MKFDTYTNHEMNCSKPNSTNQNRRRAFTLVEMLLVITIIGILAALVIPKMVGRSEQARQAAVRADLSSIKTALDAFEVDNGKYPKNIQDLLLQSRDVKNWHGPYLDNIPQDRGTTITFTPFPADTTSAATI